MENIKLDKNNYDKFIFKGSLALEGYFDFNDNNIELFNDFNKKLKYYRILSIKDDKSKEEIVQELIMIINKIGKDNFIIYNDGDVEYNFSKTKRGDEK